MNINIKSAEGNITPARLLTHYTSSCLEDEPIFTSIKRFQLVFSV